MGDVALAGMWVVWYIITAYGSSLNAMASYSGAVARKRAFTTGTTFPGNEPFLE